MQKLIHPESSEQLRGRFRGAGGCLPLPQAKNLINLAFWVRSQKHIAVVTFKKHMVHLFENQNYTQLDGMKNRMMDSCKSNRTLFEFNNPISKKEAPISKDLQSFSKDFEPISKAASFIKLIHICSKASLLTMINFRPMKITGFILSLLFSSLIMAQNNFDIEGHRGCRGLYPENTIPAFINAVKLGVNTLEMDIIVSKDGQLVISHDPFMNDVICTNPDGTPVTADQEDKLKIYNLTYAEIKKFDVGMRPNPKFPNQVKMPVYKPRLVDVIDTVEKYVKEHNLPPVHYNIETKSTLKGDDVNHPKPYIFTKMFYDVIKSKGVISKCILQSFDPRTLQEMRKMDSTVTTALLVANLDGLDKNLQILGFNPTIYSPYYKLVNKAMIKKCHAMHIKVLPWTVNDEKTMLKLKRWGVDGLISDYPDREIKVLR